MKFLRFLLVPFAFLVVGIVRLIAPWKLVRFGEIWSSRLGHLVGNLECYLCEKDALIQPKSYDIWFCNAPPANRTIYRKYAKKLHIWPREFTLLVIRINALFLGWEKHFISTLQVDRDIKNLTWVFSPHIEFTEREEKKGRKLLRSLDIPEGAKWVCLIVRDSAYLKAKAPRLDFSYHDYRDADCSNYVPAAIELARRGYYVIRMGHIIAKPFFVKHTKIIDYPFKRTEFGDLYLGAKCAFCLGTSTGFMAIPQFFNRPLAVTDYVPLEYAPTWSEGLVIWKHYLKNGNRMSVKEIAASGGGVSTFGPAFEQAGIKLEDNTSQEILDLAMEAADRDQGIRDEDSQDDFWKAFPFSVVNGQPLHGKVRIRVGRNYLKEWKEWR